MPFKKHEVRYTNLCAYVLYKRVAVELEHHLCFLKSKDVVIMKTGLKKYWNLLKDSFTSFSNDNVMKMSAALSYYTIFSLPPMLLVTISLLSIFFGREAIQGEVFGFIKDYVGPAAAAQIQSVLQETTLKSDTTLTTIIGAGTLLMAATGIFGEMQNSINTIWGLKTLPKKGLLNMLLSRIISFSMILVLGFVLMVSLLLSTFIEIFLERLKKLFDSDLVNLFFYLDYVVIFLTFSMLLAFIFKVLPDAKVGWKYVFRGAMLTSLLFMVGKYLISFYLNNSMLISAYGGAGSLIVLLVWVYYSSIIVYFGAEFTHAYMRIEGQKILPKKYAKLVYKEWQ